jgi:hypothetical protein
MLGNKITTIINKELDAGSHEISIQASQFNNGSYYYQIISKNYIETKKFTVIK